MRHSAVLVVAYAAICLLWWGLSRLIPWWQNPIRLEFKHPWREVGLVFLAVLCTLALGQLWTRGIRFEAAGIVGVLAEALNQAIIFAPIVAIPFVRRNGAASAWIQPSYKLQRIAVGFVFALIAIGLYSALEQGAPGFLRAVLTVFNVRHLDSAVQVFLEDVAIAIAFVRISAALGTRAAIALVALLFAAAHIPAMLADGASAMELFGLVRDVGLGILVIGTLSRGADILWFWSVHFALDMTQFIGRTH